MKLDKKEIVSRLEERGAVLPCHRCGKGNFSIMDGYSKYLLQDDLDDIHNTRLRGMSIPVILVACNNCGAITAHAMGALGLMPPGEKKDASGK